MFLTLRARRAEGLGRGLSPRPAGRSRPFVTLAGVTPEDFRKQGYALIDWIADYLEGVERFPVASTTEPG